jgi:hypothetical protein
MAICPFFDEGHIMQCKVPAFGPLSPAGCNGRPFWVSCTVPPLAWRRMVSADELRRFADDLKVDTIQCQLTLQKGE